MHSGNIIGNQDLPILIIDDSAQYTHVLIMMLESHFGFKNITTVDNIPEAYDLVRDSSTNGFDLMFVDHVFPDGETGANLLTRLANEGLLDDTLTFLVTSSPSSENFREAKAAGAIGVIAKPFNREQLQSQLGVGRARLCLQAH